MSWSSDDQRRGAGQGGSAKVLGVRGLQDPHGHRVHRRGCLSVVDSQVGEVRRGLDATEPAIRLTGEGLYRPSVVAEELCPVHGYELVHAFPRVREGAELLLIEVT